MNYIDELVFYFPVTSKKNFKNELLFGNFVS